MEKWKRKAVELITDLALRESKTPAVVPYYAQKEFVSSKERPYFKRISPRKASVRASLLTDMLSELEREPRANIHSIIVVKSGNVICEASAPGYSTHTAHLSHSMSKTLTMLAIGFLFDEHKVELDRHVCELFPEVSYTDKRFARMTVEDLLTMRSGVAFAEAGTVTSDRWTESFFEGELKFAPGEKFEYNSMNSYILSRIVTKITGQTLTEYLHPRLLAPLSIENFFWEKSSEGASKGGFGVYMSAESWAKIGCLILGLGMWQGEQLISRSFLMRALCTHSETSAELGDFDYGYHIWVGRGDDEFLLNGMFGQNVWVCPEKDLVVAMNSGNNELFSRSPALDIVRKHLSGNIKGKSSFGECRALRRAAKSFFSTRTEVFPIERDNSLAARLGLKPREPFDSAWISALGTYAFPDNNSGILPLFVRVMQNNYSGAIKSLMLSKDKNKLFLTASSGAEKYRFEVGFYSFVPTVVNFAGERYIISAAADTALDEDGQTLYRIELRFPELPNTKLITMKTNGIDMSVTMSETPNEKIAEEYMKSMPAPTGKNAFLLSLLEKSIGRGFVQRKLHALFNPTVTGINTDTPGWEKTVNDRSREESARRERENGFIISLISKIMPTYDVEPAAREQSEAASEGGIFKKLFGRFLRRDTKDDSAAGAEDTVKNAKNTQSAGRQAEQRAVRDFPSDDGRSEERSSAPFVCDAPINEEPLEKISTEQNLCKSLEKKTETPSEQSTEQGTEQSTDKAIKQGADFSASSENGEKTENF